MRDIGEYITPPYLRDCPAYLDIRSASAVPTMRQMVANLCDAVRDSVFSTAATDGQHASTTAAGT